MQKRANLEFRKIKSLKYLYEVNENGTIFRNVKSKKQNKIVLDKHHSKKGYYKTMIRFNGKTKRVMMHKVVAECWLGECPDGYEIDHIDRNSLNNDYRNLRYVTHSEQMKNRKLSDRIIKQATMNCLNHSFAISKKVTIKKADFEKSFHSKAECARYLAKEYDKTTEAMRYKLKSERAHIFDYDISYGM